MALQVFISHLHSDHIADLASLYIGAMFGRTKAWEVWGPSGPTPELGLAASIKGLRQVRSQTKCLDMDSLGLLGIAAQP